MRTMKLSEKAIRPDKPDCTPYPLHAAIRLLALLLVLPALASRAFAYEETNMVPFDPSFETNLWAVAKQSKWVISTTLHVDNQADNSSDSNNGSPDAPLKTLTRAVTLSSPGTRILVHPGTYRESVAIGTSHDGTELAPVIIEATETGKAVLSGSNVYTNWTQYSGNTYYTTWANNWGVAADPYVPDGPSISELGRRREMVFVDGHFYWQVLTMAEMTPGTFYVDEAANRIFVQMADGSSPSKHLMEISERNTGLNMNWANYVVVRGLVLQHFEGNSFIGRHILIEDCSSSWNDGGNSIGGEDYVLRRVSCYNSGKGALSISPDSYHDLNSLLENCTTSYGNWRYGTMGGMRGYAVAAMKLMRLDNLIIRGHTAQFNDTQGIWTDSTCDNVLIEDSLITDNNGHGVWAEICHGETVVRNNTLAFNKGAGVQISNTCYLRIHGNLIYNNATQIGNWHMGEDRSGYRTVYLSIFDNVIYGPNPVVLPDYTSLYDTISAGRNLYYPALWNAKGHDTTSTQGDPKFRNPNQLDFTVLPGSPLLSDSKWAFVSAAIRTQNMAVLSANRSATIRYADRTLPVQTSTVYRASADISRSFGELEASVFTMSDAKTRAIYGPVTRLPYACGKTNLCINPGFELGSGIGWDGFGGSVEVSSVQPHSGGLSGRAYARRATWGGPSRDVFGLLEDGRTYRISSWVRLENVDVANVGLTMGQNDDSTSTKYISIAGVTASNGGWSRIEGNFTLNVNGTLDALWLYWSGPDTNVVFYVDDVAIYDAASDGSWDKDRGGSWGMADNWRNQSIAYGDGNTAYFTNDITADRTVTNTYSSLAIGSMVFGSPDDFNWTVKNNTIHLLDSSTPVIAVNTNSATVSSVVTGMLGIVKTGAGTLILAGANTFTGSTTVRGGMLVISNKLALQDSTLNFTNGVMFGGRISAFTLGGIAGTVPMGLTNATGGAIALTVDGDGVNTYSGAISGGGSLTKDGAGTLTLSGTNTYTGGSTLSGGLLWAANNKALGAGTITIGSSDSIPPELFLDGGITITNPIVLNACPGITGWGMVNLNDIGTATINGPITIHGSPTAGGHFSSRTGVLKLAGPIVSAVPFSFRLGTHILSGGGNYTNMTATGNIILGADNGIATNAEVKLGASGAATLDLAAFDQQLAGLTKAANTATVTNSSPALSVLTLRIALTNIYDGTIAGNIAMIKTGGGTLTLSASCAYSGRTTVSNGTLAITPGGSIQMSTNVTVAAAASLQINGTGNIIGDKTPVFLDGMMYLTNGVNETAGSLYIDGAYQYIGTWGATGSGATHTNNSHFGGTGRLILNGKSLNVMSPYGQPTPAGLTGCASNEAVSVSVAGSPLRNGSTQYVATGWSGSGSVPASGSGTNLSFNITSNTTIMWTWKTQYLFSATAGANGSVVVSNGWYDAGTPGVTATAVGSNFYHSTGWTGDLSTNRNPLVLTMGRSYSVVGLFAENMTANHPTPERWLDGYYPGTNSYENAAELDTDRDGFTGWQEYIAGTNPTNGNSFLKILSASTNGSNFSLTWLGGSMSTNLPPFGIRKSTNLLLSSGGFWTAGSVARSANETNTWIDPEGSTQIFYRIVATNTP